MCTQGLVRRIEQRILLAAGMFAALDMLLWAQWSSSTHLLSDFIRAVVSGVIFALLFVLLYVKRKSYIRSDCRRRSHYRCAPMV